MTESVVDHLNANLVKDDDQPVAIQRFLDRYSPYYRSQSGIRHVYNVAQVKDCERTLGLAFPDKKPPAQKKRYKRSEGLLADLVRDHGLRIVQEDLAAYAPSWDVVMMPNIDQFDASLPGEEQDGAAHYWATLWHEVIH